jgi:hemerythrin-like metal-binding protein
MGPPGIISPEEGMEWSDKLLLGVEPIDSEHIELIRQASAFGDALKGIHAKSEIIALLESLVKYAEMHRQNEEGLLLRLKYPHYKKHLSIHESLFDNLYKMCGFIERNSMNPFTSDFIADTTSAWFMDHIRLYDRDIGNYIRSMDETDIGDLIAFAPIAELND